MGAVIRNLGRVALVAAAVAVGVAGCRQGVEGVPLKASDSPTGVDTTLLITGNYPIKPAPMGTAGDDLTGRKMEGARIAAVTVTPWEVESGLVNANELFPSTILSPGSLGGVLGERTGKDVWNVAFDAGFVAGFATSRKNADPAAPKHWLQNAVLQFPDAPTAAATASAMTDTLVAGSGDHPRRKILIPGHTDSFATQADLSTYVGSGGHKESGVSISSLTPHGPFILYQQAEAVNADVAASLVAGTLDKQVPMIDGFAPTEKAALPDLPRDPTGLLARTLPGTARQINTHLVWDPRTLLNFIGGISPVEMGKIFKDTGVQFISTSLSEVYQTSSAEGARRLRDVQIKQLGDGARKYKPSERVQYLPDSACFEADVTTQRFTCYTVFENYAFNTTASLLADAQQQLAAQYRILADK